MLKKILITAALLLTAAAPAAHAETGMEALYRETCHYVSPTSEEFTCEEDALELTPLQLEEVEAVIASEETQEEVEEPVAEAASRRHHRHHHHRGRTALVVRHHKPHARKAEADEGEVTPTDLADVEQEVEEQPDPTPYPEGEEITVAAEPS